MSRILTEKKKGRERTRVATIKKLFQISDKVGPQVSHKTVATPLLDGSTQWQGDSQGQLNLKNTRVSAKILSPAK